MLSFNGNTGYSRLDSLSENHCVTVGLASYNRPQLLQRAIDSIKAQSYINLEILISDNGSTDPLVREVINDFVATDSRARSFFHQTNHGAFFNFRFLLENAQGKYFIWLADDDYWSDTFIETLVLHVCQTKAALTCGRAVVVDVELPETDMIAKEMPTSRGNFKSLISFARFDTDSIFYGLFETATGKRCANMLRDWYIPSAIACEQPFLRYNFVSYVFIYGVLATGSFCNASSDKCTHYVGGRAQYCPTGGLGRRQAVLFLIYILIHLQMLGRMARAAWAVLSITGMLLAPLVSGYLFIRRFFLIVAQRLRMKKAY